MDEGNTGLLLAEKLRSLRLANEMTLMQVVEKCVALDTPVSDSMISRIEKGKRLPSLPLLKSLITVFDVSKTQADELMTLRKSIKDRSYYATNTQTRVTKIEEEIKELKKDLKQILKLVQNKGKK